MTETLGAWDQRKLTAMRRIQQVAMDLFDQQGYDRVTVEAVAAATAVSSSSIYRYFGTKEAIVLWDEHDRGLLASIGAELEQGSTLSAVAAALRRVAAGVDALDGESLRFVRRRIEYIRREPALWQAMHGQADEMAASLRVVLAHSGAHPADALEPRVLAAALASAVLWAVLTWAEGESEPLAEVFDRTFRALDAELTFTG